jgi:Ferritin-like domain
MSTSRRAFLAVLGMAGAAGLDACTGSHGPARTIGAAPVAPTTTASTTTTTSPPVPPGPAVDILVLQTASSIEHFAAGVYTRLAGTGVVMMPGVGDALRLFADHHTSHGGAFEGATGRAGGTPFTHANPALSATFEARIEALGTEADVLSLAYGIEQLAAATYASNAVEVSTGLAPVLVGVAAAEARHLTVLATFIGGVLAAAGGPAAAYPADGFFPGTGALSPGVGLT